jgi:YihY family inner membrane protein
MNTRHPDSPPEPGHRTAGRPNAVETAVRRLDKFQQSHTVLGFPIAVMQKFGNDQGTSRAALIAYYGLFALFPLLLLFTTILGYVLHGDEHLRKDLVDSALGSFPIIGTQLQSQTHTLQGSGVAAVIGGLLLLYGAFGLGQATQSAMNAVWNIPYVRRPSFLLRNLRGLGVLALLALSTIGSTVLTAFATLTANGWPAKVILLVGSVVLNFGLILAAFMIMTATPIRLRELAVGSALATLFWQSMQALGSWYVARGLSHNSDTYGFFGVVIVLLSWIYLGAHLFLLAAEINVVLHYRLWPRSLVQPPLTAADRQVFERLVQTEIRRPEAGVAVAYTAEAERDPLRPPPEAPSLDSDPAESHPAGSP